MMGIVQAADTSADAWIDSATLAIVVAVIALLGVLVAQTITLINERAKRRDELTRAVRDEVQRLMMAFYDWVEFARHTYPGKRIDTQCEPFEEQWATVSPALPATAARMAGRGRHRTVVLTLIDGITIQSTAYREGESIGSTPQAGYTQMGWAAFDTVAAWLRGERVPRHARRTAREAQRMRERLDAEYMWREREMDSNHKSGVVRVALRKSRWWLKARYRAIAKPIRTGWDYLFAP